MNPKGVRPPHNALDVERWADLLPSTPGGSWFQVTNDNGNEAAMHVSKHNERFLRTLIQRPIKCGSRCRVSQCKAVLKELGVVIECEGYYSDSADSETFGVYFLRSIVTEKPDSAEAA